MPLPSESTTPDRRIALRHHYYGRIAVRLASGHAFIAQGIDIAIGGIAFHCDENLARDTRCDLHFSLAFQNGPSRTCTLSGIVMYTSLDGSTASFKVAVRFEGHSALARDLLAKYVSQRG